MSVMLYMAPGEHLLHGVKVNYIVVDELKVEEKLAEGWSSSPSEAHEKHTKKEKEEPAKINLMGKPTREKGTK